MSTITSRSTNADRSRKEKFTWEELIRKQVEDNVPKLKRATCKAYSTRTRDADGAAQCKCGRLARDHSFDGDADESIRNADEWSEGFIANHDVTVYGQLNSNARFIRCDPTPDKTVDTLFEILTYDVSTDDSPKLLITCYGGAEGFTMTDSLEKEFVSGIGELAATNGVWIVTTGLNNGVSKLISHSVHRHQLLYEINSKPILVGMTWWYKLNKSTRSNLEGLVSKGINNARNRIDELETFESERQTDTLDAHHTHFILFDDSKIDRYVDDSYRSRFVRVAKKKGCHAVTIIVEGGISAIEVIMNDLKDKRPVVIIDGSGRLSDVLCKFLDKTSDTSDISIQDVKAELEQWRTVWPLSSEEKDKLIENIVHVLQRKNRRYLKVFRLGCQINLTNTIFRAVFDTNESSDKSGTLLDLTVTWNCLDGANDIFRSIENNTRKHKLYAKLFEQALEQNRPLFVDYFLRHYHNPMQTSNFITYRDRPIDGSIATKENIDDLKKQRIGYALKFIIETLYKNVKRSAIDKVLNPTDLKSLDKMNAHLIGPYSKSFFKKKNTFERLYEGISSLLRFSRSSKIHGELPNQNIDLIAYLPDREYKSEQMLRDLFLWSVYAGHVDIARILLLQLKSRIGLALVAAGIARHLSSTETNLQAQNKYNEHRLMYEEYATKCIEDCYMHNQRLACQLLLREIPLLGNITCMQAAVASRIVPFINTHCCNQVLDRQWYGHLNHSSEKTAWTSFIFLVNLMSFGVLAPITMSYHQNDTNNKSHDKNNPTTDNEPSKRKFEGINQQSDGNGNYFNKFKQFHTSPVVKMFYDFVVYIWFLLVFSYMMLFHVTTSDSPVHWTEIYLIVTVTAMLVEQIRKVCVEFLTRMIERWHKADSWILIIYLTPYILFYIGIGLHLGSMNRPWLLTSARIVLAIDLELWFIVSLRFVSAIKLLGPKLFMIRNMMRYLVAFMYIIFVGMAAYGVVSRALVMYSSLEFTAKNLSRAVLYRPYWFLYSVVDDERNDLDEIIFSDTSTSDQIAEATVTHILLAFHMLFINILLLNLLIAVFNFAINDVHDKNEFFWRYQRYELIREYFEKPMFLYPPLSFIIYIYMFFKCMCRKHTQYRVLKHLATEQLDVEWTDFEGAATYQYARDLIEKNYRSSETDANFSDQLNVLNEKVENLEKNLTNMQVHTNKMINAVEWMTKAMHRVKMSSDAPPSLRTQTSTSTEKTA